MTLIDQKTLILRLKKLSNLISSRKKTEKKLVNLAALQEDVNFLTVQLKKWKVGNQSRGDLFLNFKHWSMVYIHELKSWKRDQKNVVSLPPYKLLKMYIDWILEKIKRANLETKPAKKKSWWKKLLSVVF